MILDLKDGWAVAGRKMPTCSFPPEHLFAQPSVLPWASSFVYIFVFFCNYSRPQFPKACPGVY